MHVDERHHDPVRARQAGILVAERQRGFVAVVAIGDEQLLIAHEPLDLSGVRAFPNAVDGAVLVFDFGQRRGAGRLVEQRVHRAGRVRIEHEKLTEVGVGGAQQFEAVLLRTGERLLMTVHHAGGIVLHRAQRDKPFAHQALSRVRNGELLEVRKHARFAVARQDPGGDPFVQVTGGAGVRVIGVGIRWLALAEDHADQVIRA